MKKWIYFAKGAVDLNQCVAFKKKYVTLTSGSTSPGLEFLMKNKETIEIDCITSNMQDTEFNRTIQYNGHDNSK